MRKIVLCLSFLIGCLNMYADKGGVLRIVGNLRDVKDSIFIMQTEFQQMVKYDSFSVNNGRFNVILPMEKPRLLFIWASNPKIPGRIERIQIFGVPGETLQLVGTFNDDNYTIIGSKFYQQYAETEKIMLPFRKELKSEMMNGASQKGIGMFDSERLSSIQQRRKHALISFAKEHPNNEALLTYLGALPVSEWDSYLNMISPAIREGRMKAYYQPVVDMYKNILEKQEIALKEQRNYHDKLVGSEVPDFTLTDINGKPLSLSSLYGKFLVLDFWGTWCGPCVQGIPEMKKYYEKYKGKYEILSIDCNDSEEKWKNFVIENALPWLNVQNKNDDNDVRKNLGVYAYPTKMIIDPQGKIVSVFVGETKDFYTYLDNLFQ